MPSAPSVWGPPTWKLLHLITIKPTQPITTYQEFFYYLRFMLPCKKCQHNYTEHVYHLPIPKYKKDLSLWLIQVHNRVNQSIHKEQPLPSQLLSHWQQTHQEQTSLLSLIIPVMYYFIQSHPGYYKTTPEFHQAHQLFWNTLPLFFSHLPDSTPLTHYLTTHPPPILYKERYFTWFKQLQKHFHYKTTTPLQQMHCDKVCRI